MRSPAMCRFASRAAGCTALLFVMTGCHSAFVQATVINRSGSSIQLFEVDYPHASFGAGQLDQGAPFHYRFKISGDGPLQVVWTDALGHEHKEKGPDLHEGEEGTLQLVLGQQTAQWTSALHPAR